MRKINRREIIQGGALFVTASFLEMTLNPFDLVFGKNLTTDWKTIGAFCDTLMPKTELTPAATDVGVILFIKNICAQKFVGYKLIRPKNKTEELYRQLVTRLNLLSKEHFKKNFIELRAEEKREVVEGLSSSASAVVGYKVAGMEDKKSYSDLELYSLVRTHVLQGHFSDPSYGGNKNFKGWEALRYTCHFNYPKAQDHCPAHDL